MSTASRLSRLHAYLKRLTGCLGHADRDEPLRDYVVGLLMPGERKSIEPMAARLSPTAVSSKHQSLHHFISESPWDANRLLDTVRSEVLPTFQRLGGIKAWIIDDTGFPKKGRHSVGVSRQYCGVLGKQDNCQVSVSISLANVHASLPAAWRLYLPEAWCEDEERRKKARVPKEVIFRKKWEIALDEVDRLQASGVPWAPILADAGYGGVTEFREALVQRGRTYAVGIPGEVTVWTAERQPLPPKPWSGRGPRPTAWRTAPGHRPVAVATLAGELPDSAWKMVTWREGSAKPLTSRFAAVRVRAAHRQQGPDLRPEEWLVIEWPLAEAAPTKYRLSNLPNSTSLEELVATIHMRWRIERDYQELKDEIGIDHFEGRSWRGFHHHAALCIAAYGFIAAERARLFPPQNIAFVPVPQGQRPKPRGSPT
jgi:SRSO17 transposase